jgi:hypothetical protein
MHRVVATPTGMRPVETISFCSAPNLRYGFEAWIAPRPAGWGFVGTWLLGFVALKIKSL